MIVHDVLRVLRAYRAGKPLPCGQTKRVHLADDANVLIVSFVRMGGESRPWGIAFGKPGCEPKVLTVPDSRNRDAVAAMSAKLAPILLRHLRCPGRTAKSPASKNDLRPARQIWMPNETHLDMLHHLAYAYARTTAGGDLRDDLNALGRACGWLFRESQRPGQQSVLVATQALRDAYAFPCEPVRQSHLGYLVAWLEAKGGFDRRLAKATEAERRSIATTLDPDVERNSLASNVELFNEAKTAGNASKMRQVGQLIHASLAEELQRRWLLTDRALAILRSDPRRENSGLERLVDASVDEHWYQYVRLELKLDDAEDGPAFVPSVETDRHAAAAAARYFIQQASAELIEASLVHDDSELLAEWIAAGDGFGGRIVGVRDAGTGRSTRPIWTIEDNAKRQLRLRPGSRIAAVGFSGRQGEVRSIDVASDGRTSIEVELTARKTNRELGPGIHSLPPTSDQLLGRSAAFVAAPAEGLSRTKSFNVWESSGPGAWLTHAKPSPKIARVSDEDADDVAEVETAMGRRGEGQTR